MRRKLQVKNPVDNLSSIAFRKISTKRKFSMANNRFSKLNNNNTNNDNNNNNNSIESNTDKRVSLITGKKMHHAPMTKRSRRYRKLQLVVYNYLERPVGFYAVSYQLIIFATVFLCLILSVLATIPNYENEASDALMYTEIVIVFWLSIELTLRVWSAGCRSRYQTWKGRLKFMKNIFCILDLTVIIASITLTIIASSQNKHKNFAAAAFRGLRFFQILRMLRVDRRAGTWRLLGTVVWAHRQELITTFYIGFLSLVVSSFIMYLIEKDDKNSNIKTFADSLWWGVITLCTIGYGDVVPVTWGGKLLASSCALIGISFFALPAGILGSGFALKVQAMQRQKHLNRRRAPAATLIQCLWRCYAADPNSISVATWKTHLKAIANAHPPIPNSLVTQPVIAEYSIANLARPYIGPNSFLNRVTSIKRRTPPPTTSSEHKQINESKSYIKTNSLMQLPVHLSSNPELLASSLQSRRDAIQVIPSLFNATTSVYSYNNATGVISNLPSSNNYTDSPDNYQDNDSPQNSQSNGFQEPLLDSRMNSSYALALHQVSNKMQRQGENQKIAPVKSSLAHRTLNFLSDFNASNLLRSDLDEAPLNHSNSHSLFNSNKPQLTNQQKNAIRVIRKIKYFVARRKFREALRPYDVTDVIEQYSAGNLDMLARIKTLQFRLDKILGSTKSKDCYDSNNTSLASRILKVERQMDDISIKLDKFLTSYSLDMKLLMEKTTENNIINEKYLKYGDEVFKNGKDILPTVITPSMIYHKKSVCELPSETKTLNSTLRGDKQTKCENSFQQRKGSSNDESNFTKFQNDFRIMETIQERKPKHSCCIDYQSDNLNYENDYFGFYEYEDFNKSREMLLFDSNKKSRNLSKSDNLIRFVDRRKRINKYLMKKYFINSIRDKINQTNLKEFKLKKFKSDNEIDFHHNVDDSLGPLVIKRRNVNLNNMYDTKSPASQREINKIKIDPDLDRRHFNHSKNVSITVDSKSESNDSTKFSSKTSSSNSSACLIEISDENDTSKYAGQATTTTELTKNKNTNKIDKAKSNSTTEFYDFELKLMPISDQTDQITEFASKSDNNLKK